MEKIIEIIDLSKKFGDFQVLNQINMTVEKGDIYGFLGPNGAGKSTTIRCLLSLIKPDQGEVKIFGKKMSEKRNEILSNIGCIIEKPDLYNELSAEKNLVVSALTYGLKVDQKEIHKTIEMVGLAGKEKNKVGTFSQGMKQRIGLAQALLHNPELIILDEPASGLDPQGIIDIRVMIKRLNEEFGKTIFLSSHDLSEIEQIATSMVILNKGQKVVEGRVEDLLSLDNLNVSLELVNEISSFQLEKNPFFHKIIDAKPKNIVFNLSKNEIPTLLQHLKSENIDFFALNYRRSLEDYFLKLTA